MTLGSIVLPDDMRTLTGWQAVSCERSDEVRAEHLDKTVRSSLTDLDGRFGGPVIFTEWATADGRPLLRDYRWGAAERPCEHYEPEGGARYADHV
ncbi:hypothetical protein [Microbacterium gilvum]